MRQLAERYAWVEHDYDLAWTVAVIENAAVSDVLAAYGAASEQSTMTFTEALAERAEHLDDFGLLQIVSLDTAVVAIEPNGWTGADPKVAEQLAAHGGHFFAVYWSPVAYEIVEARDGHLVGRFDPNFIGMPAGAKDLLPGWVEGDDFPLEHIRAASLAALEQRTGVQVQQRWLTEPLATYRKAAVGVPVSNRTHQPGGQRVRE